MHSRVELPLHDPELLAELEALRAENRKLKRINAALQRAVAALRANLLLHVAAATRVEFALGSVLEERWDDATLVLTHCTCFASELLAALAGSPPPPSNAAAPSAVAETFAVGDVVEPSS